LQFRRRLHHRHHRLHHLRRVLLLRRFNIHIHIVRFHLHHFLWRLILISPSLHTLLA
jgi:hypothetical protein